MTQKVTRAWEGSCSVVKGGTGETGGSVFFRA